MPDKTSLGISDTLRAYIEELVKGVVLEGESFEDQMKWLRKYSEAEGVNYTALENSLTDFFDYIKEWKSTQSKSSLFAAKTVAKDCYLDKKALGYLLYELDKSRSKREEVGNKVKEIIANRLNVDKSELTDSTSFVNDLFVDSFDIVEMQLEFEHVFGESLGEYSSDFPTIGDVIDRAVELSGK